jgi:hypothetical protein
MALLPFDVAEFPMLTVCVHPGCKTILLGEGSCVAHDVPRDDRAPVAVDDRNGKRPDRTLLSRCS